MSCESRNAQAIPADPPPTMTTSAGMCGREMLSGALRKVIISFEFQVSSFEKIERLFFSDLYRIDKTIQQPPDFGTLLLDSLEPGLRDKMQIQGDLQLGFQLQQ